MSSELGRMISPIPIGPLPLEGKIGPVCPGHYCSVIGVIFWSYLMKTNIFLCCYTYMSCPILVKLLKATSNTVRPHLKRFVPFHTEKMIFKESYMTVYLYPCNLSAIPKVPITFTGKCHTKS